MSRWGVAFIEDINIEITETVVKASLNALYSDI